MDVTRMMRPLAVLTAVSLLLAVFAAVTDRRVNAVPPPQRLLPQFADRIAEAHSLSITHGRGLSGAQRVDLVRKDGQWVLPQRRDYPAAQELVIETLLAMADVQTLAARTAQPQFHGALGLTDPQELGSAIRFAVRDAGGAVLADILVGRTQQSEAEAVQQVKQFGAVQEQFYVRRSADAQSWLARGRLPRNPALAVWLDGSLPRHDMAQLAEVRFDTTAGPLAAVRVTPDSWSLPGMDGWLTDFAALQADDVADEDAIDFAGAKRLRLVFADGLSVTYENLGAATVIWTRLSAETGADATPEARQAAAALNARYGGRALRFDAARAPVLLPSPAVLQGG